jgi:hypothetical protein
MHQPVNDGDYMDGLPHPSQHVQADLCYGATNIGQVLPLNGKHLRV